MSFPTVVVLLLLVLPTVVVANSRICDLTDPNWIICPHSHVVQNSTTSIEFHRQEECIHGSRVPSTILAAEIDVANDYQNPYHDLNALAIPDLSWMDTTTNFNGTTHYTRWYIYHSFASSCTTSSRSSAVVRKQFLLFRGIQYQATVWFVNRNNGAVTGSPIQLCCGMFQRVIVPVPESNTSLVIHVTPPPTAGRPSYYYFNSTTTNNYGQGGNHEMARNGPIAQFSLGWDWIQHTPDRHTGIWDKVQLLNYYTTEKQQLQQHCSSPTILGFQRNGIYGTDNGSGLWIDYSIATFNKNHTVDLNDIIVKFNLLHDDDFLTNETKAQQIWLQLSLYELDTTLNVVRTVPLSNGSQFLVYPDTGGGITVQLGELKHVQAWWPYRFGDPILHTLKARLYFVPDCTQSQSILIDSAQARVGFRTFTLQQVPQQYSTTNNKVVNVPVVNGNAVFVSGGNWIAMDQYLRDVGNYQAYYNHLYLHKQLGFDMIRVWGGGITERPEFYMAADELGLLIWQEFYMTGDNNGRWAGNYQWPDDYDNYLNNAKDMSIMLHNHCSLVIWCLGNELDGHEGGGTLNQQLYDYLTTSTTSNTPYVLWSSMGNWTTFNATMQAAAKDGNYGILSDAEAFTWNPAVMVWNNGGELVRANGTFGQEQVIMEFNPEAGSSAVPVFESFMEMFSPEITQFYNHTLFPTTHEEEANANDSKQFSFPDDLQKAVLTASSNKEAIEYINEMFTKKSKAYPLGWHNYQSWRDTNGENWIFDRYGPWNNSLSGNNSAKHFCQFANLAHFEQVRLLFEGRLKYMGINVVDSSTPKDNDLNSTQDVVESAGNTMLLYWKSQSPWPSFRGFLYDWNLRLTGGFYGARTALSNNLHIFAEFPNKNEVFPTFWVSYRGITSLRRSCCNNSSTSKMFSNNASVTDGSSTAIVQACAKLYDWYGQMTNQICKKIDNLKPMSTLQVDLFERVYVDEFDLSEISLVRLSLVCQEGSSSQAITTSTTVIKTLARNEYFLDTFRRSLGAQSLINDLPQLVLEEADYASENTVQVVVGWQPNKQNINVIVGVHLILTVVRNNIGDGTIADDVAVNNFHNKFTFTCDIGYFNLVPGETRRVMCNYRMVGLFSSNNKGISVSATGLNVQDSIPSMIMQKQTVQ